VLTRRQEARVRSRRLALKKIDEDAFKASILAALWERKGEGTKKEVASQKR